MASISSAGRWVLEDPPLDEALLPLGEELIGADARAQGFVLGLDVEETGHEAAQVRAPRP